MQIEAFPAVITTGWACDLHGWMCCMYLIDSEDETLSTFIKGSLGGFRLGFLMYETSLQGKFSTKNLIRPPLLTTARKCQQYLTSGSPRAHD